MAEFGKSWQKLHKNIRFLYKKTIFWLGPYPAITQMLKFNQTAEDGGRTTADSVQRVAFSGQEKRIPKILRYCLL